MADTEKQEGQKTVVAFITGLLIGGLLVWVFSSTPDAGAPATVTNSDDTDVVEGTDATRSDVETVRPSETISQPTFSEPVGEGSIEVSDQPAGDSVALGALVFPTTNGWVAVRELMDGVPANVLGAARYSTEEGLSPSSVSLQRATEVGSSYLVVFYSDDGDKDFNLRVDRQIDGPSATFKAQ